MLVKSTECSDVMGSLGFYICNQVGHLNDSILFFWINRVHLSSLHQKMNRKEVFQQNSTNQKMDINVMLVYFLVFLLHFHAGSEWINENLCNSIVQRPESDMSTFHSGTTIPVGLSTRVKLRRRSYFLKRQHKFNYHMF